MDPDTHIDSIEQAELAVLEGTANWSAKIAVTGTWTKLKPKIKKKKVEQTCHPIEPFPIFSSHAKKKYFFCYKKSQPFFIIRVQILFLLFPPVWSSALKKKKSKYRIFRSEATILFRKFESSRFSSTWLCVCVCVCVIPDAWYCYNLSFFF